MRNLLYILCLVLSVGQCTAGDTLLVAKLREFIFAESHLTLDRAFYVNWAESDKPLAYLYISRADSVATPDDFESSYRYFGFDTDGARKSAAQHTAQGHHAFCYNTYANSSAKLSKRLMMYPDEAIAFVMFHEFIHNYLDQKNIRIAYEFNEALCDVVGNYEAMKYCAQVNDSLARQAAEQCARNERMFASINTAIRKVNHHPRNAWRYNARCEKRIQAELKDGHLFQRDRLDYAVNNAFLLKNEYYCKNYFLLKKVYLQQNSLPEFLKIMENLPPRVKDYEAYLLSFCKK
jgi:hypothetical protein